MGRRLVSAFVWLVLVSVGREYVAAAEPAATQLETIVAILLEGQQVVAHVILTIVFALARWCSTTSCSGRGSFHGGCPGGD